MPKRTREGYQKVVDDNIDNISVIYIINRVYDISGVSFVFNM